MDLDSIQKPFIWRKKYEEQGIKIDEKQIELEHRKRAEANRIELEKIKERQRMRQLEHQQRLSDSEFLSRQKELEQHKHWEEQGDDFNLKQLRLGSKIRIGQGRPKTIDMFAYYIDIFGAKLAEKNPDSIHAREEKINLSDSPVELLNPCDWFNGLRLPDIEKLESDIEEFMKVDLKENQQYWTDLLYITEDEATKLKAAKDQSNVEISSTIRGEILALFEGKSVLELDELEGEIRDQLRADNPVIDVTFYKSAIPMLRAYRSRIRLTTNHKSNLRRQKDRLLDKPKVKSESSDDPKSTEQNSTAPDEATTNQESEPDEVADEDDEHFKFDELRQRCVEAYNEGRYTPEKLTPEQLDPTVIITNYDEDYHRLCMRRDQICNGSNLHISQMSSMSQAERSFMKTALEGMDNNEEATFSCEAPVRAQTFVWTDKYQPRKPRYFNRVHTGFEWNKYNQTHYDIDNPPPKVVQGYKFNIFYPDLIDKSKAPTFSKTPCEDDKDFCVIRFSAGPPYEDIAFRIVNREWNNSRQSGYRCQFINNILQLWFQFKRYRYRR